MVGAIFLDVSELEFMVEGKPKAEVADQLYIEDALTIAECKSNDQMATDKTRARTRSTRSVRSQRGSMPTNSASRHNINMDQ